MEVRPGYKHTEVGVIPDAWGVSTFAGLFSIVAGGGLDPARSASEQDERHCYPIYSNAVANRGLYGYCSYSNHEAGPITITARGHPRIHELQGPSIYGYRPGSGPSAEE